MSKQKLLWNGQNIIDLIDELRDVLRNDMIEQHSELMKNLSLLAQENPYKIKKVQDLVDLTDLPVPHQFLFDSARIPWHNPVYAVDVNANCLVSLDLNQQNSRLVCKLSDLLRKEE